MSQASWDRYGMDLARVAAGRSRDPSTQCGAVILDTQHRLVSSGYNGLPRGIPDDPALYEDRERKLALVLHAEQNAILFAQRDLTGATIYVWPMPPCSRCAALIVQAGIRRVVSLAPTAEQDERWGTSFDLARWLYQQAGIELVEVGRE
jgi:dCMP deaminase